MWWWIGAYVISVVLCVASQRFMYRNSDSLTYPDIADVMCSFIPLLNLLFGIAAIVDGLKYRGMPQWLYRLYGGK